MLGLAAIIIVVVTLVSAQRLYAEPVTSQTYGAHNLELTMIFGRGLLFLVLVGIATVIVPSRREHREVQEG